MKQINVDKEHCPSSHSLSNKLGRVVWGCVWLTLFRPSPSVLFGWRRWILRCFGAQVGTNARIHNDVRIWAPWNLVVGDEVAIAHGVDCYCVDQISIGRHATVSQYAYLCSASHDVTDPFMTLTTAPITISDQAWVCAGAFIGPGVVLGQGAVAGAHAVVMKSVAPWKIVVGNPAKVIKDRILR